MNWPGYDGYMKEVSLKSIVWKEGDKYVAQCLNVDVSSFGMTRAEALENIKEALELYFENSSITSIPEVSSPSVVETSLKFA